MFRKLICIISFVTVLGMGLTVPAKAADPNLVGYWPFDEGSGTIAYDVSGHGNDGVFVGDPQWVAGMFGSALEFNGDDYLDCGNDPSLNIRDQITMAFWFKVDAFQNSWEAFMSKGDGSYRASRGPGTGNGTHMGIGGTSASPSYFNGPTIVTGGDWHHYAGTYDGTAGRIYIDGVLDIEYPSTGQLAIEPEDLWIANNSQNTSRQLHGVMDDVRLYNRALTLDEIQVIMAGGGAKYPLAAGPKPEDGAILDQTWATLTWRAGDSAVSHNVYLSDNFDDVNNGTPDSPAFQGNKALTDTTLIVGFFGFPIPDGLVPGTTYYWRVDEVNDADPNSPWIGDVWSFMVPSKIAHDPVPADAVRYVAVDVQLSWTGGFGSQLHTIYFGDDFDTVANATGGALQADTTFDPGQLEKGKTYYWRVDEFETSGTHKGEVWSFTTEPEIPITDPNLIGWWKFEEGSGTVAVDSSGHDNHGELRGDPQWTEGRDGGALDFDGTDDFIYIGKNAGDLGIEGAKPKSVAAWVYTRAFNNGGIFDMGARTAGQDFSLRTLGNDTQWRVQHWGSFDHDFNYDALDKWVHFTLVYTGTQSTIYANGVPISSQARDLDTSTANPFQIALYGWPQYYFDGIIDDVRLYNKALTVEDIQQIMRGDTSRSWAASPADGVISDVVRAATLSWSPGDKVSQHAVYFGTDRDAVVAADESDTTGVFKGLQAATSYVPEGITMDSGPFYWRVDEHNTDGTITKGNVWSFTVAGYLIVDDFESYNDTDNLVYERYQDGFANPNTNGSAIGYVTGSSMETGNVRSGKQSVPFIFNNTMAPVSEVTLNFTPAQDWTVQGVQTLSLWFAGAAANVPGQFYVKINGVQVNYDNDASNLTSGSWQVWNIDLTKVGTNLSNVTSFAFGIQGSGANGTLLIDDIRLYAQPRELITPVQPGNDGLLAYYPFNGDFRDVSGNGLNGTPIGTPTIANDPIRGQIVNFNGSSALDLGASDAFNFPGSFSISVWAKIAVFADNWGHVIISKRGENNLGWQLRRYSGSYNLTFTMRGTTGADDPQGTVDMTPLFDKWIHIAAVYDAEAQTRTVYVNGFVDVSISDSGVVAPTTHNTYIGARANSANDGQEGFFTGSLDDVRIYNRALTPAEIAGAAGRTLPFDKSFDD